MEPPQFYTETLINNAFAFESPDQWGCQVTHYGFGHSEMGIEVSNGQDIRRYVHFSMVHYFSGTLKWMGANFQLHPWEDSLLLLQGLGLLTNFGSAPLEIQKQIIGMMYKLYTIKATHPKVEIQILAATGTVRQE